VIDGSAVGTDHQAVLDVARELGIFGPETLAELTGRNNAEIETLIRTHPGFFERVGDDGNNWRVVAEPAGAEDAPGELGVEAVETLVEEAILALKQSERGLVHDEENRRLIIQLAEQRIRMAQSASGNAGTSKLRRRLAATQRRIVKLREQTEVQPDPLLAELRDWTARLTPRNIEGATDPFNLDVALAGAIKDAVHPNSVLRPAHEALARNVAQSPQRYDLSVTLDHAIRGAALKGQVFQVLALGCVAAVSAMGTMADPLVAAITTPAFRTAVDREALRIAYTALSNLARPGTDEAQRAVEACTYLLRRERPGRLEMELLAPAAMQSPATGPNGDLVLISQWLKWEQDRDPHRQERLGNPQVALSRLGHFARNLACSLDSNGYAPLERGLPPLADDELGVLLVTYLSDVENKALQFRTLAPNLNPDDGQPASNGLHYGVLARARVARVTDPDRRRPHTYLQLWPGCRMAEAIEDLAMTQDPEQVRAESSFTSLRRKSARRHG